MSLDTSKPSPFKLPRYQGRAADRKALVDMQRVLFARTLNPDVPAHIAAQCARAWRDLQDMKRIMDGKPLPGQLRPEAPRTSRKRVKAIVSISPADLPSVPQQG